MPTLRLIKWLLSAAIGVPVLTLLAAFALLVVSLLLVFPGGQGILIVEWERAKEWLPRARAFWRRKMNPKKQVVAQKYEY